jgi:hypothetical protein
MAYTTKNAVQNFLQRDLTEAEVATLADVIPAVKEWIDRTLGSTFDTVEESVRLFNGGQSSIDIDPCTDITAITALNDDGTDNYAYNDVQNYEVIAEPQNQNVKNELVKRFGKFPRGENRIAVTAKFSEYDEDVPSDIKLLATRLAGLLLAQGSAAGSTTGTVSKESLEGHTKEYKFGPDTGQRFDGLSASDATVASILDSRRQLMADYSEDHRDPDYDDEGGLVV